MVVLGIGAHPDDLDFSAAGTFAKWVKAQKQVSLIQHALGSAIRRENSGAEITFKRIMNQNLDTPKALLFLKQSPSIKIYKLLGFKD